VVCIITRLDPSILYYHILVLCMNSSLDVNDRTDSHGINYPIMTAPRESPRSDPMRSHDPLLL
jgi:hypothetical protein